MAQARETHYVVDDGTFELPKVGDDVACDETLQGYKVVGVRRDGCFYYLTTEEVDLYNEDALMVTPIDDVDDGE